jgi:hypothetical protein
LLVSPVDQTKFDPEVVNVELPHPSVTDTTGAEGMAIGLADAEPFALVHPPTVCVTV